MYSVIAKQNASSAVAPDTQGFRVIWLSFGYDFSDLEKSLSQYVRAQLALSTRRVRRTNKRHYFIVCRYIRNGLPQWYKKWVKIRVTTVYRRPSYGIGSVPVDV